MYTYVLCIYVGARLLRIRALSEGLRAAITAKKNPLPT